MKNVIPTSTVVVRRACLEQVGVFDEARELISVVPASLGSPHAERRLMHQMRVCYGLGLCAGKLRMALGGAGGGRGADAA